MIVADVEVEGEHEFGRRQGKPRPYAVGLANRAIGRGDGDDLRFKLHLTWSLQDILDQAKSV